jgi:hypothetical protein
MAVLERVEVTPRDLRLARDLLQRQPAPLARLTKEFTKGGAVRRAVEN